MSKTLEGVLRRILESAMSADYIDSVCRESARILKPSGYLLQWADTFRVCEGYHLRITNVLKCVDLIAWDSLLVGMGKRSRRRGGYLLVLQKPPITPKTWRDHGIADRWPEKIGRKLYSHPHAKPIGLISRLIGAVTEPGELVVDPAAGSFVVMHAAHQLEREFIGCDIAYAGNKSPRATATTVLDKILRGYCDAQSRILAARSGGIAPGETPVSSPKRGDSRE
jgi:site-specific DNA-methyltransferase (adenine-specific)